MYPRKGELGIGMTERDHCDKKLPTLCSSRVFLGVGSMGVGSMGAIVETESVRSVRSMGTGVRTEHWRSVVFATFATFTVFAMGMVASVMRVVTFVGSVEVVVEPSMFTTQTPANRRGNVC